MLTLSLSQSFLLPRKSDIWISKHALLIRPFAFSLSAILFNGDWSDISELLLIVIGVAGLHIGGWNQTSIMLVVLYRDRRSSSCGRIYSQWPTLPAIDWMKWCILCLREGCEGEMSATTEIKSSHGKSERRWKLALYAILPQSVKQTSTDKGDDWLTKKSELLECFYHRCSSGVYLFLFQN